MCFDWCIFHSAVVLLVSESREGQVVLTGEQEDLESWAGVEEDAGFWTVSERQFSACTEHQADRCSRTVYPALERRVETQLPLWNRQRQQNVKRLVGLRIF